MPKQSPDILPPPAVKVGDTVFYLSPESVKLVRDLVYALALENAREAGQLAKTKAFSAMPNYDSPYTRWLRHGDPKGPRRWRICNSGSGWRSG